MQWRSMRWERIARRIRVPLGFLTTALFLYQCAFREPHPAAVACSLLLVVPGLALRAAASGTVKKNRELTVTGPYAYTRNPLYLGSAMMAAGFALALLSWPVGVVLAVGFAVIYIPVIFGEERFLRSAFPAFDAYCQSVPRFFPRVRPARVSQIAAPASGGDAGLPGEVTSHAPGGFSPALYRKHREYNAALGAALLYLGLIFLHPVLELILHGTR
jgi:protein-S-isoprenylcysteine O-methyltransferase Ste14